MIKNRFARLSRALQGQQGGYLLRPTWQPTRQPGRPDSDHPRSPQGEPTNHPQCVIQPRRPLGPAAQRKHRAASPPSRAAPRSVATPHPLSRRRSATAPEKPCSFLAGLSGLRLRRRLAKCRKRLFVRAANWNKSLGQ